MHFTGVEEKYIQKININKRSEDKLQFNVQNGDIFNDTVAFNIVLHR